MILLDKMEVRMIVIPTDPGDRAFAIDCMLDDMDRHRLTRAEAGGMLAQLRAVGDVAMLERLARALDARN